MVCDGAIAEDDEDVIFSVVLDQLARFPDQRRERGRAGQLHKRHLCAIGIKASLKALAGGLHAVDHTERKHPLVRRFRRPKPIPIVRI